MQLNHQKILLGLQMIFQLIFLALITWPPYNVSQSIDAFNWPLFLSQLLFQFLLNQCFFLFSRQRDASLIQNPLLLLLSEALLIVIIVGYFSLYDSSAGQLLLVQWILLHTTFVSIKLMPISTALIFSGQIIIYQKLLEMTQTRLLWDNQIIFYFLLYFGLLAIIKSIGQDKKISKKSRLFLLVTGVLILIGTGFHGLNLTELTTGHVNGQFILAIILISLTYIITLKIRMATLKLEQLKRKVTA